MYTAWLLHHVVHSSSQQLSHLLWVQLWAVRRPFVASHYQHLTAPADGDVALVQVSEGLTRWAQHTIAVSPPGCRRCAGRDPTTSLNKTNAEIRTLFGYGSIREWAFMFLDYTINHFLIRSGNRYFVNSHTNVFIPWNLVIFWTLTSAARLASSDSALRSSSSSSSGHLPCRSLIVG